MAGRNRFCSRNCEAVHERAWERRLYAGRDRLGRLANKSLIALMTPQPMILSAMACLLHSLTGSQNVYSPVSKLPVCQSSSRNQRQAPNGLQLPKV